MSADAKDLSLTRLAAKRLQQISSGQVSAEVSKKASLCLLDFLGACQSGLESELGEPMIKYAVLHAGKPEVFSFGTDKLICAETAAFVHAVLANSTTRDDMHLDSCAHIGSMAVAASLAVAQRENWSGEKLIRAIIGGYEMGAVLGYAIRGGGTFNTHFRASGLVGAFAAAGALSTGDFSDQETVASTLSLAVNMACGVNAWAHTGGSEIYIHNGSASRAGVTSYDLGRTGISASDTVLEGKDGFFEALGVDPSGADRFRDWIESSSAGRGIMETHFKPAACCNFTQTSTAIALKISRVHAAKIANVKDVSKIKVTTTSGAIAYPGCDNAGPLTSKSHGKLSIQYGVAAALVFGRFDEESSKRINDASVNNLMHKTSLATDSQYEQSYAKGLQPAKIEITFKNGTVIGECADDVPWLNEEEVTARFLQEISPLLSAERAETLVSSCQKLESFDVVTELLAF